MTTPLLQVKDLQLAYGKIAAVKGINLSVEEGRVVCLIGANGAGKTTTLRGLSGLMRPASGSIRFAGQEIGGQPAHRIARQGLIQVPEGRQVFAQMTVAGNLRMGAYTVTDPQLLEQRLEEVLTHFPKLRERLQQPAGWMSGGEQQMLAMGRAMMAAPRLLLLDEPSMGLAPLMVEEVFRLVAELKSAGKTILVVEQNAQMALDVADYAYVLENGRIRLEGPATAIAEDPTVLAAYLGGS
ncbi:MAG TPA: ABC transporter ATP-binding protein [Rhodospirillaceae bacterium]|nr:ABC transporter ATP-binding protein [Rhodospirillaceae bacterium]